jgi:hypothetical protein
MNMQVRLPPWLSPAAFAIRPCNLMTALEQNTQEDDVSLPLLLTQSAKFASIKAASFFVSGRPPKGKYHITLK